VLSCELVPRPSNTHERRAQIVDALLTAMSRVGYERATIAAIAEAADLAPGLVHYHFETKQDILVALVDRLVRAVEARVDRGIARAGEDPRRRTHALVDAFVAMDDAADPRAVAAWVVVGAEAVRIPEVRALYAAALARSLERMRVEIAGYLVAEGRSARNAKKIAAAVLAAIEGAYQIAVGAPGLLPAGFAAPTLRTMIDGLVAAERITARARSRRSRSRPADRATTPGGSRSRRAAPARSRDRRATRRRDRPRLR
jgi:TetR/AcrR family transcriptional repressor of bet genes